MKILISKSMFLLLIGFLAHGLLLIDPSLFWDDYFIFNSSFQSISRIYQDSGIYIAPYLYKAFLAFDSVWAFKFGTFASSVMGSLFLYHGLRKLEISDESAFSFAVIHLTIPLMVARVSNIHVSYVFCYMGSLAYFYFLAAYLANKGRVLLLVCAFFAWLSCYVIILNPLNFLILFAVIFYFWKTKGLDKVKEHWKAFAIIFSVLIIHLIHWKIFCQPSGVYAEYNKPELGYLFRISLFTDIFQIFFSIFEFSFWSNLFSKIVAVLTGIFLIYSLWKKKITKESMLLLAWGVLITLVLSIPYLLIDKIPSYESFSSRLHIVYFISASMILMAVLKMMSSVFIQRLVLGLWVSTFCVSWYQSYLSAQHDFHKLVSVKYQMKNIFPKCRNIQLNISQLGMVHSDRIPTFIELSGLMNYKMLRNDHFVSLNYEEEFRLHSHTLRYSSYTFALNDIIQDPKPTCVINAEGDLVDYSKILKLSYASYFNQEVYKSVVRRLSTITIIGYPR